MLDSKSINEKIRIPLIVVMLIALSVLVAGYLSANNILVHSGLVLLILIPLLRLVYATILLLKEGDRRYALSGFAVLFVAILSLVVALIMR